MAYLGNTPQQKFSQRYYYTASNNQTTFSGTDNNGATLKYEDNRYVDVFLNGIKLLDTTDYTATSKTSVVLSSGAAANDSLEIYTQGIFTTADTVSASSGGTFNENVTFANNVTVSSSLSVGGSAVSPVQSFRNKFINGNFDHWQRETSNTNVSTGGRYVADRWINVKFGAPTLNISRQAFTVGQTDVPYESQYFYRANTVSSTGTANGMFVGQRVESVRTLAGQTATLSFYAKANASKNVAVEFVQNFGTNGSAEANGVNVTTFSLTSSWQKFNTTITLPSLSGKTVDSANANYLGVNFWLDAGSTYNSRTNTLGQQSGTFDIAQVQLEAGSVATPFEMRPIGAELALCQRYYEVQTSIFCDPMWNGYATSGYTQYSAGIFRVRKRVAPTVVLTNSNANRFPAVSGSANQITPEGFYEGRAANSTGQDGYFASTWTASAEL